MSPLASRLHALPPHEGSAQRRAYGRGMDALTRARRVVEAGGTPTNLSRRLPGGSTIGEVLADEAAEFLVRVLTGKVTP